MLPQGAVAGSAALQFCGRLAGAVAESGVFLGLGGSLWIQAFEVFQRDGGFGGEGAIALGHEGVGKALVAAGGDQQAHLEAPVAEVSVADHFVATEAEDALQAFTDDGRAQVADMHWFGDVRAAVVDHNLAGVGHACGTGLVGVGGNLARTLRQGRIGQLHIDEAGTGDLDRRQGWMAFKVCDDLGGQLTRVGFQRLGCSQRAIGLEVGEIGAVRRGDAGKGCVHAFGGEGGGDRFAEYSFEVGHYS